MTAPYLVACLATLRAEFNALNPSRDKGSDGWIGDAAHQQETSDHNPDAQGRVLAVDIDSTGPWPVSFSTLVESLRGDARLEYIIWNRRIASRGQGWTWRTYTGTSDPHTGHAHFSARHDHTGNTSTAPWPLEDVPMPLNQTDLDKIEAIIDDRINALLLKQTTLTEPDGTHTLETPIGKAVLSQPIPRRVGEKRVLTYALLADLGAGIDEANDALNAPPAG